MEYNADSFQVRLRDTFTYYSKENSLFVKAIPKNRFHEQYIKELTDTTLTIENPEFEGLVFHYKALKRQHKVFLQVNC